MAPEAEINPHFDIGNRALLVFMGQRFLVTILSSDAEKIRISFPVSDFPIEGMYVTLEFHDETGFASYETEVVEAARQPGDGLALKRPPAMTRTHHRTSWRIPADFSVEMKDHVHPRRTEAPVINLSAGGLLVRSAVAFDAGDNMDLYFRLPGDEQPHAAVGQVVYVNAAPLPKDKAYQVGIKFVGADPVVSRSVSQYIWRRLRELHPHELQIKNEES
ncbi:MAG: PilZ domain-containing protein [Candidatus Hydrogenedentes bacterium]|nr:PilZ domain-containing protein [Candidatus Hydrogenedentota bacterium]MBI3118700.1 PilZ domain-containing protein [Candidatus Hydrogenedentota bacterium]